MSRAEEERWIKEEEVRINRERAREKVIQKIEDEKERVKELHWMRCPKCGYELETINYNEVLIDKCLHCEGLFFDKGEFETLLQMEVDDRTSFFKGMLNIFKR